MSPPTPPSSVRLGLCDGRVRGRRGGTVGSRGAMPAVQHLPPQADLCPVHPGRRLRLLQREKLRKVGGVLTCTLILSLLTRLLI